MKKDNLLTIVIADDSHVIRERLALMLFELEDVEIVGQAKNGIETIDIVNTLRPDVLVLDIWMPEMNGIEVVKAIRQNNKTITIIMFTNDVSVQHRQTCMKIGANYFLRKSEDFEKLPDILQELKRTERETN